MEGQELRIIPMIQILIEIHFHGVVLLPFLDFHPKTVYVKFVGVDGSLIALVGGIHLKEEGVQGLIGTAAKITGHTHTTVVLDESGEGILLVSLAFKTLDMRGKYPGTDSDIILEYILDGGFLPTALFFSRAHLFFPHVLLRNLVAAKVEVLGGYRTLALGVGTAVTAAAFVTLFALTLDYVGDAVVLLRASLDLTALITVKERFKTQGKTLLVNLAHNHQGCAVDAPENFLDIIGLSGEFPEPSLDIGSVVVPYADIKPHHTAQGSRSGLGDNLLTGVGGIPPLHRIGTVKTALVTC